MTSLTRVASSTRIKGLESKNHQLSLGSQPPKAKTASQRISSPRSNTHTPTITFKSILDDISTCQMKFCRDWKLIKPISHQQLKVITDLAKVKLFIFKKSEKKENKSYNLQQKNLRKRNIFIPKTGLVCKWDISGAKAQKIDQCYVNIFIKILPKNITKNRSGSSKQFAPAYRIRMTSDKILKAGLVSRFTPINCTNVEQYRELVTLLKNETANLKKYAGKPHINQIEDAFSYKKTIVTNSETQECKMIDSHILYTKYCNGGDLLEYFNQLLWDKVSPNTEWNKSLPKLFWGTMTGLNILHLDDVPHGDIKRENLLFQNGEVIVCDLEGIGKKSIRFNHETLSPERHALYTKDVTKCKGSLSADIWSLGCVFAIFYTFSYPNWTELILSMESLRRIRTFPVGYQAKTLSDAQKADKQFIIYTLERLNQEFNKVNPQVIANFNSLSEKDANFFNHIKNLKHVTAILENGLNLAADNEIRELMNPLYLTMKAKLDEGWKYLREIKLPECDQSWKAKDKNERTIVDVNQRLIEQMFKKDPKPLHELMMDYFEDLKDLPDATSFIPKEAYVFANEYKTSPARVESKIETKIESKGDSKAS